MTHGRSKLSIYWYMPSTVGRDTLIMMAKLGCLNMNNRLTDETCLTCTHLSPRFRAASLWSLQRTHLYLHFYIPIYLRSEPGCLSLMISMLVWWILSAAAARAEPARKVCTLVSLIEKDSLKLSTVFSLRRTWTAFRSLPDLTSLLMTSFQRIQTFSALTNIFLNR